MSRPSSFTPELGDHIIALMSEGASLRDIAALDGMPSNSCICLWGNNEEYSDKTFVQRYARARIDGCHSQFEDIGVIEKKLLKEEFADPQNARIALDSMKWRLSKMVPKIYGDRQHVEHSGEIKTSPKDHAPEWMLDRLSGKEQRELARRLAQPETRH